MVIVIKPTRTFLDAKLVDISLAHPRREHTTKSIQIWQVLFLISHKAVAVFTPSLLIGISEGSITE